MYEYMVATSYLLWSEKMSEHTAWLVHDCDAENGKGYVEALKWSNEMPSIDTDIFPT